MNEILERPIISILMAVYNSQDFLQEAIESVIAQSYVNWELICINDGSTDTSLQILYQYQENHSQIIVVNRQHSGTAAAARNAGLEISSGHFIAMLDSDDKIEPNYLEKLIVKQQKTRADIVISETKFWNYENNTISHSLIGVSGDTHVILSGKESFKLSLDWKISGIGLHKANKLKKIKYCQIGMNGDEYTTRLLFLDANTVAFCDAIYFYRHHSNSTTKKISVNHFSILLIQAMLLILIRENKFSADFYNIHKEVVIWSLFSNYLTFFKKRKSLTSHEKKTALGHLKTATKLISIELFKPPFSIKSPLRIVYKFWGKLKNE